MTLTKQGYIHKDSLNKKLDSSIPIVYNTTVIDQNLTLNPKIYNLNIEYKLTDDIILYYGISNSNKNFDIITTITKDTIVKLLHRTPLTFANYYQIEVTTSSGKIRGYAWENQIMDWDNPIKNFEKIKNSNLALTYENNVYYSAFGKYMPNIPNNWHLVSEFTLTKTNIDWLAGFTSMIASNTDDITLVQKPGLLDVKTGVYSELDDSRAQQKFDRAADALGLINAFLEGANKSFFIDIQLQSYKNERKIVILTGSPIEAPLAGKKNVHLSDLILQNKGNGVFFQKEKLADEAIRNMFPQLTGKDQYSMVMNFSNDFKNNPYGYEIIIDKNQHLYASPIIHNGTSFEVYYQGKVVLDASIALGTSLIELDPDTSNEILQLLKSNGFSF